MKKILALVLAMVMVLTAVAALADSSKSSSDTQSATTSTSTSSGTSTSTATTPSTPKKTEPYWTTETAKQNAISLKILPSPTETVKEIIEQLKNGISGFDSDVQNQLKGFNTISEIVAAMFEGDTSTVVNDLEAEIQFKSVLPKSQDAKVVIMDLNKSYNGVYNAKTTEDGKLTMTFAAGKVRELKNEVFAMIVVTK